MILNILFLVVGIVLILWGADKFTDGACGAARQLKVSELMIGMTVVAFGTSLPEFVVSLFSSLQGSADMSIGNVFGSNLFNTLVIVGASAMVMPMALEQVTIKRDLPLNAVFAVLITAACFFIGGREQLLSRPEGLCVLAVFLLFMGYSIVESRRSGQVPAEADAAVDGATEGDMKMWKILVFILLGIGCLVGGGQLLVDSATEIAREMGVSESIIGLTILAGGTSLPELATSMMAARKGKSSLAIGNAIGSNLFNIGFVLGVCSSISPMHIEGINYWDGVALILSSCLLWLFCFTGRKVERYEGALLVLAYGGYLAYKIMM